MKEQHFFFLNWIFFFLRVRVLHQPIYDFLDVGLSQRRDGDHHPWVLVDAAQLHIADALLLAHVRLEVDLVEADEERQAVEAAVLQQSMQLRARDLDAREVVCVEAEDDAVAALRVAAPLGAESLLAAEVPHLELYALLLDHLDVEADRGEGLDGVADGEDVEEGRLAGILEADEAHLELLVAPEEVAKFRHKSAHFCFFL